MRLLAYCVMLNHWHLVLWPQHDGQLSRFITWLTLTHTQRWHAARGSTGTGHLCQGRYKSFEVQADDHLLAVCRYVERNPSRARVVAACPGLAMGVACGGVIGGNRSAATAGARMPCGGSVWAPRYVPAAARPAEMVPETFPRQALLYAASTDKQPSIFLICHRDQALCLGAKIKQVCPPLPRALESRLTQ